MRNLSLRPFFLKPKQIMIAIITIIMLTSITIIIMIMSFILGRGRGREDIQGGPEGAVPKGRGRTVTSSTNSTLH